MTNPDDRMLWIRNLEGDAVSDGFDAIEVEIGSECRMNGVLDYEDGAILLGASTHDPNNVGLYKYLMKLKLHSQPAHTLLGKPNGYLFRDGHVGELVALISLCLQVRLYILSTTVGHLTSHGLPIKTEFSPLRVRFGRNVDPVVFSATDRNFAIELPSFLDQVRRIPSKYHLAVALSSNHYARALREIGVDEEMVFVRLVAAIETAALNQPVIADELSNKTPEELFRTENLTAPQIQELKKEWGHPLKGPCQEEKLILCEKIYFLAKLQCWVTSISTFAETSFHFWCQSLLHQSPIRIKVFWALWSHGDKIKAAELRDP